MALTAVEIAAKKVITLLLTINQAIIITTISLTIMISLSQAQVANRL